jgi:hypothetical protein
LINQIVFFQTLLRVFQRWNTYKSERNYDQSFNQKNFINGGIMERIFGIRSQIIGQLRSVGLVSSQGNLQYLNANSSKWCVVKACLVGGLYPNVAKINKTNSIIESQVDKKLSIHMSSVLLEKSQMTKEQFQKFPSEYVLFEEKVRIRTLNLCKNNTVVHPIAIILVSGTFHMENLEEEDDDENDTSLDEGSQLLQQLEQEKMCAISIDKWIKFNCNIETGFLLQGLRKKFDALLLNFLRHTKNYNFHSNDNLLIDAIVRVLDDEDKAAGFRTVHHGIGTRPRAFTLKFSSDLNHGTPEFEHNEASTAQKFFRSNSQGDNLSNVWRNPKQNFKPNNKANWRSTPKTKLEIAPNPQNEMRHIASAPSFFAQSAQNDRQWTHKNLDLPIQNFQKLRFAQPSTSSNNFVHRQQHQQQQTNCRYFVAVFPNHEFIKNIQKNAEFELDHQFNRDSLFALMQVCYLQI